MRIFFGSLLIITLSAIGLETPPTCAQEKIPLPQQMPPVEKQKDDPKSEKKDDDKKDEDKKEEDKKEDDDKKPEPNFLMSVLAGTSFGNCLAEKQITISGWTDLSFTGSTARRDQSPFGFNYRANEFLLQQTVLRIERAIDPKAKEATFGFRSDWLFGSDYRYTIARGLWDSQLTANNGTFRRYGIDPVQFYGEAYLPDVAKGLNVKVGRFFAPYGVESIASIDTPLASRSYSFIYNPFTNTGVLSVLQLDESWSVKNGLVLGNDVFIDAASSLTYIGGLKYASEKGDSTFEITTLLGSGRFNRREKFNNPQLIDVVLTQKLSNELIWKFEGLYGWTRNSPNVGFANWYGLVNYLTYDFSEHLSGTVRGELFDDCQGQRTGTSGLYKAATVGLLYKPTSCLWLRPEIRFDHNNNRPFEGKPSLFTATMNVVLVW